MRADRREEGVGVRVPRVNRRFLKSIEVSARESMAVLFYLAHGFPHVGIALEKVQESIGLRQGGVAGTEEGDEAVEGAALDTVKESGAYHA
jgi:hypothetical protein